MQPYYYITVKYPNSNQKEFMMNVPFGYMGKENKRIWSISNYDEKRCKFNTLKDCAIYIQTRFNQDFNAENVYEVMYVDEDGNLSSYDTYRKCDMP